MERLTDRNKGIALPASANSLFWLRVHEKLASYEDAEEQGRLVVFPFAVGDTVWTNLAWSGWYFRKSDKPYSAKIIVVGINDSKEMGGGFMNVLYDENCYMNSFQFSDIGKTVFLTREEAEKALEGMK